MTFLNPRVLLFAAIVAAGTLAMYLCVWTAGNAAWTIGLATLGYALLIALGAVLLSRDDPYQYFGFNYHFVTYVVCLAVPLCLRAAGRVSGIGFVGSMALSWGIGVAVHFVIFILLARKRRIKGYDKAEIFR